MIYLDYAASAPILPEAADEMDACARTIYANPSAPHGFAGDARRVLQSARRAAAAAVDAETDEIVFTSGGTEANQLAVLGGCRASSRGRHIVVGATEHASVLQAARALEKEGFSLTIVPCGADGVVPAESVYRAIRPDTALVSVQYANNETGVLQPVSAIGAAARAKRVPFHCDAVSAFGHVPIDVRAEKIDLLSASAHKIGGPKGAGFLYIRNGIPIAPLFFGGAQERALRPGTENVPAIAGFRAAIERSPAVSGRSADGSLRDYMEQELQKRIPGCRVNGQTAPRLPNILSVVFPGVSAETMLLLLSERGIYASARAACSSGEHKPSHVLTAMGLPKADAESTLRFSFGKFSALSEIELAIIQIVQLTQFLKIGL